MIGVFSYTVILTYLSFISACLGIAFSLNQSGNPYIGVFFLLFCGLCDGFDGKVASSKKNRSAFEKKFGIQVDSLADLVAFGILPMCIGIAVYRSSFFINDFILSHMDSWGVYFFRFFVFGIFLFYALAAMIRLAYFNVTEEERQKKESGARKTYTGLPVTSSTLIFPILLLLNYLTSLDLSLLYIGGLLITGFLFLLKFQIKKLDTKRIMMLVCLGIVEFLLLIFVGGRVR